MSAPWCLAACCAGGCPWCDERGGHGDGCQGAKEGAVAAGRGREGGAGAAAALDAECYLAARKSAEPELAAATA
ncbi:hypothetical protein ACFP51_20860 [Streptomyces pratens]|uniref:Uncharacterized protein n=1 Tax=Streptomyces pratens TaxID=887456 RepID=A0ABW1MA00_9ACTN